jgi:hypothetical protein
MCAGLAVDHVDRSRYVFALPVDFLIPEYTIFLVFFCLRKIYLLSLTPHLQ